MGDRYEITAIVDPLEKRRERAKAECGCILYDDYRKLIENKAALALDLVVNATPSHLHAPITLDLLKNGFNVLSEKPFARTAAQVDELIETARENGGTLAIFQQYRYNAAYRELKRIVDSGILGRIIQVSFQSSGFFRRWDWQTLQEYNAGSLYNTGPHMTDQLLQLLSYDGMPDVRCYMDRVNTFGDAPDYVKLIMTAPGRPVMDLEISCCDAYPRSEYHIQAQFGGLRGNDSQLEYKYYVRETAPHQHLTREPIEHPDGTPAYCGEKLEWIEKTWSAAEENATRGKDGYIPGAPAEEPAVSFYTMLYNHMVNGAPLEVTLQQVRQQIAVIEECHRQNPMSRME